MKPTVEAVFGRADNVFLSDGGWGSELFKLGLTVGESPERWNIEHSDKVQKIADSYVAAGSDIILTNSFGANKFVLSNHGLESEVIRINKLAVDISRKAAGSSALVFASLGPTGKKVSKGEINIDDAKSAFTEQAFALRDAGADAIVIETMTDIDEFAVAVSSAVISGLPVVGSMSFDSDFDCERMAKVAVENGAAMVGANCGEGIEKYMVIAESLIKHSTVPVWIKANAGLPVFENRCTVYKQEPSEYAEYAKKLKEMGVRVIGGCCGTSPLHIIQLRKMVNS